MSLSEKRQTIEISPCDSQDSSYWDSRNRTDAFLSKKIGFGKTHGPGCVEFFTLTDTLARTEIGAFIIGVVIVLMMSAGIIVINKRYRRRHRALTVMQILEATRDLTLAQPPDDASRGLVQHLMLAMMPPLALLPQERVEEANECVESMQNRNLYANQSLENGNQYRENEVNQNNENNSRFNALSPRREDFYDYERTRHRAQSPPPGCPNHIQPINNIRLDDQDTHVNQILAPPANALIGANNDENTRRLIPTAYLDCIFPHRNTTKNKYRSPFTKVQHRRQLVWSVANSEELIERQRLSREDFLDKVICISNLLYAISYTPLACYLMYTADKTSPFLNKSFEPFVTTSAIKGSLDSLIVLCIGKSVLSS